MLDFLEILVFDIVEFGPIIQLEDISLFPKIYVEGCTIVPDSILTDSSMYVELESIIVTPFSDNFSI